MSRFLAVASFYNSKEEHIDITFENVLKQTHKDWILIVCDDFNEDPNFREALRNKVLEINDHRIIYYETQYRREIYLYQNFFRGIKYDYYFDLDTDDILDKNMFRVYDGHFNRFPEVYSIFSDFNKVGEDGSLQQLSLIKQPETDYLTEWEFRDTSEFSEIYSIRTGQSMFGVARCMRRPDEDKMKIEKLCKTSTDSLFLFYNLNRGEHLHIPRRLYTYINRDFSDSSLMSSDEHSEFNLNARKHMNEYSPRKPFDPYSGIWEITSSISSCNWLDTAKKFTLISRDLSGIEREMVRFLYPEKLIEFNNYKGENQIVAWDTLSQGDKELIDLERSERCTIFRGNMDFDIDQNNIGGTLQSSHSGFIEEIGKYISNFSWYLYYRQCIVTRVKSEGNNEDKGEKKMKVLFIAPHLSTGGMPEFLLSRVKSLSNEDYIDVHVMEYCQYSDTYTVQRDLIKKLIPPDRFHEVGFLNSMEESARGMKVIGIIDSINPDVIHIEECPEAFDGFNRISKEAQDWIYDPNQRWKIVETCHNIWFNPKRDKKVFPDAFATVSPEHTKNTFSTLPSLIEEINFPIVQREKSSLIRDKKLRELGFDPEKSQYHIINIGLWTPGKNQIELLRWANEINSTDPGEYQFHFIGNQADNFRNYWEPLMESLPSNVNVHGERKDVDDFYHIADLVSFNSISECNPLAIRQTLGWDIPMMARNLPQYHDIYKGKIIEIVEGDSDNIETIKNSCRGNYYKKECIESIEEFKDKHLSLYGSLIESDSRREIRNGILDSEWAIVWDSGPTVTSLTNSPISVKFYIDEKVIFESKLEGYGHWCRPVVEYWEDWTVTINGNPHKLDMSLNQTIQFDSSSLGDTLAFLEPCVEFKEKWGMNKLYIATHKNWLFDKKHYEKLGIEFINPGEKKEDSVALWKIGVYMEDPGGVVWFRNKNRRDWRKIYLGDIASDFLGVPQVMRAPKLSYSGSTLGSRPHICIATESTAQAKYWNNPSGWQDLVNHYRGKGYDVYNISNEEVKLYGIKETPKDLDSVYKLLEGAEIFYGISSGLSWLAWCSSVPVVIISGFTPEKCEFSDDKTLRIIDKSVCNSCWENEHFDRGDWNWCPLHKGTDRQFECTKGIKAKTVIEKAEIWLSNIKDLNSNQY